MFEICIRMSFLSKIKKKGKQAAKGAKKVGLATSKGMVKAGKIGTTAGKVGKKLGVPGSDKVLATSRAAKADGRLARTAIRGQPIKKKQVAKAAKNTARMGMAYA